jgi:hypothetical protein
MFKNALRLSTILDSIVKDKLRDRGEGKIHIRGQTGADRC